MNLIKIDKFFLFYKNIFFNEFSNLNKKNLIKLVTILRKIRKNKIIILGNGGSHAIASHVALDLSNVCKIKSVTFNDPAMITCFANDYGFDKSYKKFLALHLNKKDLVILISSSGESKNILNAAKFVKSKKNTIITFTGFKKNNSLKRIGDVNFWVNSNYYNIIENVHQCWLLFLVDFLKISKINTL
jgi:D-sedoheptulose 7-phosphate isomerase